MWLVTVAMRAEADLLLPLLAPLEGLGPWPAFGGVVGRQPVTLVRTGLGLANAAAATADALARLSGVEAVWNLGCAGALPGAGLGLGAAAVCTQAVMADLGVQTTSRLHGLAKTGIHQCATPAGEPIHNRLPADAGLRALAQAANVGLTAGGFATVGRVSGDEATARAVAGRWGCIVEEMEAAGAALAAVRHGLPFGGLRGVSNQAGHRELDVRLGAQAAQRAFLNICG